MKTRETISAAIEETSDQQVAFLQRLVQTKSTNPFTPESSSPSAPVEREVAQVIQQELHRLGFKAELYGVSSQRPNVLCLVPGSGNSEKTLILTTHMDTVEPVDYTRDPWGGQLEEGRLYGVGAADAKAQIATFIYAAHAIRKAGITLGGKIGRASCRERV